MTEEEINSRLAAIDPAKESTADQPIDDTLRDVRAASRRVIELWQNPMLGLNDRAEQVLAHLEESTISVVEEAAQNGRRRQQFAGWFVNSYPGLHARANERLVKAFSDKRLIPLNPKRGPAEEENPPARVCDEAYLQHRQLNNLSESTAMAQLTRDEFLSRTDEEKDREIQQLQTLGTWSAFVEELDDDEEEN